MKYEIPFKLKEKSHCCKWLMRVRPNTYNYLVIFTKEIKKLFSTLRIISQKQLTTAFSWILWVQSAENPQENLEV